MKGAFWCVVAAGLVAACSAPTFEELGTFPCAQDHRCPSGFSCGVDNVCSKGTLDAAVAVPDAGDDASAGDSGPDATVSDASDAAKDVTPVVDANDGAVVVTDANDGGVVVPDAGDAAVVSAKVIVDPATGVTSESGTTFPITVALSTQPSANVTIGVTSSVTAEGTVSPASLTFTPTNWSTKQTITVTGVADGVTWDGDKSYNVIFAPSTKCRRGVERRSWPTGRDDQH